MPLPTFDKEEDIPAAVRSGYIERDGKWIPDDLENSKQILNEKKKLQQQLRELEAKLGGASADEIAELRASKHQADDEAARKAGDFDKLLEKRVNETKVEYEKRLAEVSPYKQKYQDRELEITIRDAALKAGVEVRYLPFVLSHLKGSRIVYDETAGRVVVLDKDGDATGMGIEKFFSEPFKAEASEFYGGTMGTGGGAGAGGSASRLPGGAVSATDSSAFLANVDKIAKGEVKVAA